MVPLLYGAEGVGTVGVLGGTTTVGVSGTGTTTTVLGTTTTSVGDVVGDPPLTPSWVAVAAGWAYSSRPPLTVGHEPAAV
jgi:hypothetical protein